MATETKNIFLFGITGNGKSALANTLLNKNGNFERVFKESSGSISKTRNVQVEETEIEGVKYQIVDTIGISDTKLKPRQVVIKLAEACQKIKEGLTQILFVVSDKFSQDQVDAYNLLKKEIFDEDITKFITIVRTKFYQFDNKESCEKDRTSLTDLKCVRPEIAEIVNSTKMVHVDNPPTNFKILLEEVEEGDTEKTELREKYRKGAENNKEICAKSRQILINHLKTCQDTYQFDLNTFSEKAKKYLTEEEKIKKQIEGQKRRFEELDKKSKKDIERDKENNKLKKKYENQQEQSNNE